MSEAFAKQLTNLASEGLVKFFAIPTSLSTFPVGGNRMQYQQKSHDFLAELFDQRLCSSSAFFTCTCALNAM